MDSLLANYASSDEEQQESEQQQQQQKEKQPEESDHSLKNTSNFSGNLFSSLRPPKSSSQSPFFSLPPPKSHLPNSNPFASIPKIQEQENEDQLPKSSSLFLSLPRPKTQISDQQILSNSSNTKLKKVVQFRPPINPSVINSADVDDEEEEENDIEKQSKKSQSVTQTASVKSFLSSIPAPKNSVTLGALPSSAGTGRRSILEADVPASNSTAYNPGSDPRERYGNYDSYVGSSDYAVASEPQNSGSTSQNYVNYDSFSGSSEYAVGAEPSNLSSATENDVNYDNYGGGNPASFNTASEVYASYDSYGSYGDYGNHGQYESQWIDKSGGAMATEIAGPAVEEGVVRIPGKRGRNDVTQEIIEVKQDELIKNRPREDQVKLTGIAFGPSYQPVSTKGKPTKLHKRKHQIGSLYFDMRQKEMELAERRSKGFLTKAETQAKYGW